MKKTKNLASLLSLGILMGLLDLASAQSNPSETFGEVVRVDLVNVEVWVTDRDGHPVLGLTPEDFEVREDGDPVEIAYFEEIRGTDLEALVSQSEDRGPGRVGEENPAREPEIAPSPVHLVVYFDQLRLSPVHTERVVRDLRIFLATGTLPAERVMILRQSTELFVEVGFGSSITTIDEALDRIEGTSTRGTALEKNLVMQQLKIIWEQSQTSYGDPCNQFMRRAGMYIDQVAGEEANRAGSSLRHLSDVAGFLAGLDGMKTLLYVADSLETTPGKELVAYVEDLCPLVTRGGRGVAIPENLGEAFFSLTRHANSNRVTIYALQAVGLRASGLGDPSRAGALRANAGLSRYESELRLNERKGLDLLADGTGGRVLANTNRYSKGLQAMGQEMSNFYSLAYEPPNRLDGVEHRIQVKVDRPGFQVRHRQGYRAKSSDEKMAERIEGAIYLGLQQNPLEARLGAGAVQPSEDGKFVLPLHVLIPVEKAVFLPGDKGSFADFTVWIVARDGRNRRSAEQKNRLRAKLAEGEEVAMVDLALPVALPSGRFVVGVAVRDELSQETSYVSTSLQIRKPPTAKRSAGGESD